jgi:hypothetical protein
MDIIDLATQFYNSFYFSVIKFFIGIYVIVLIVDLVLLLMQRSLGSDLRETILGINIPRELASKGGKKKLVKKWSKIKLRLDTGEESQYKVAIIEADDLVDNLVMRMGYAGENMTDRLDGVPAGQLEHLEELKQAHEIRNRIIHEDRFILDKKTAEDTLALFEKFLDYFHVFSS